MTGGRSRTAPGTLTLPHRTVAALALAVALTLVAACSSSTGTAPSTSGPTAGGRATTAGGSTQGTTGGGQATGALTVSAAASLAKPFEKIGDGFKAANPGVTDVTFTFDSSGTLSNQIIDGAPADAFASADEVNMTKVAGAGLVSGPPEVFARNQLTIVVKKGNPKGVTSLADLATRADVVSLCGPDVPCGRYAEEILTRAGVAVPTDKVTRGQNVKATFTAVAEGDADAGIVYVTDVTGDRVDAVGIPAAQNAVASYPIAVLQAAENASAAEAFVTYVLSPDGQAVLADAGFLPPN